MTRLVMAIACAVIYGAATAPVRPAEPVETREIILKCGGLRVRVNPTTLVAHSGSRYSDFRSRAVIDANFITVDIQGAKLRIDKQTKAYLMSTQTVATVGTCEAH